MSHQTPAKNAISPTKEFLTFNTPASRRETFIIEPLPEESEEVPPPAPSPPTTPGVGFAFPQVDGAEEEEPATPDYLRGDIELIQRTCPPKQGAGGLFPSGGEDENVRRRLLEARRRSLAFVSKTRSPLGRTVSYGGEKNLL